MLNRQQLSWFLQMAAKQLPVIGPIVEEILKEHEQGQQRKKKKKLSKEAADLEKALSKLSDEQRTIVMADAASRDGVASNEFLEDELEIPAAHVRVYRGRAYTMLRKEMKRLGHNIPEPRKTNS